MSSDIRLVQNDEDSRVLTLSQTVSGVTSAVNLTGIQSIKLQIVSGNTVTDTLDIGDGIEVVSATAGTIRVSFSPTRTATAGSFRYRLILEWTSGAGPLTWPLSGTLPTLMIYPGPAASTATTSRIYYGVGAAGLTDVSSLAYDDLHSSLYFTTPGLSPTNQKAYVAYPAAWGPGQFYVDGMRQTEAFASTTITIGATSYYLYESTQLLTTTGLEIEVRP